MFLAEFHLLIKNVHVTTAALSLLGFLVRGMLMLLDSPLLNARVVRTLPHVVDTVLLLSAVALTLNLQQYPFAQGWLTAKVIGLVVYIILGAMGLRYGRSKRVRVLAFIGALLIFSYIVGVALTRNPLLF